MHFKSISRTEWGSVAAGVFLGAVIFASAIHIDHARGVITKSGTPAAAEPKGCRGISPSADGPAFRLALTRAAATAQPS